MEGIDDSSAQAPVPGGLPPPEYAAEYGNPPEAAQYPPGLIPGQLAQQPGLMGIPVLGHLLGFLRDAANSAWSNFGQPLAGLFVGVGGALGRALVPPGYGPPAYGMGPEQMAASRYGNPGYPQQPGVKPGRAMGYPDGSPGPRVRSPIPAQSFDPMQANAADQEKGAEITALFRDIIKARGGMEGLIKGGMKDSDSIQKFAALYGRYAKDLDQLISKVPQYAREHSRDLRGQGWQQSVNKLVGDLVDNWSRRIQAPNVDEAVGAVLPELPHSILDKHKALSAQGQTIAPAGPAVRMG